MLTTNLQFKVCHKNPVLVSVVENPCETSTVLLKVTHDKLEEGEEKQEKSKRGWTAWYICEFDCSVYHVKMSGIGREGEEGHEGANVRSCYRK